MDVDVTIRGRFCRSGSVQGKGTTMIGPSTRAMVGRTLGAVVVASMVAGGALGAKAESGAGVWDAAFQTAPQQPNIIFVLTDDLSWNLVQYMPHVQQLESQGVTFDHYIVTDSLCCPSRSSIFTGLFPHDTGVFKNTGNDGGYYAFLAHGLESKTFAIATQSNGYQTSMMGKYLNGYEPSSQYVPLGWNDWNVAGEGYPEFNYSLNENGKVVHYGGRINPSNYLTDVLAGKGADFINQAAGAHQPFLLEIATFAPHAPYTPAPRDAKLYSGLQAPRTASFNTNNANPPSWLGYRPPLTTKQINVIDTGFRERARAVKAVDDLIGSLEATLQARGLDKNTYIVFSSDNGYHMGQHRLLPGKMTAFDSDIRVPLIVTGPGVPAGRTVSQMAENIDLNPTFVQLAGGTPNPSVDGHSLVPLILGQPVASWRTAALVEHHGPDITVSDPDYENGALGGNPTTYEAIRLPNAVYVEYTNGEREYYQIDKDPEERDNVYATLSTSERAQLHATVATLSTCHGASNCWAAGLPR
jgi:N-acetylglucosamine-6-sulfatase